MVFVRASAGTLLVVAASAVGGVQTSAAVEPAAIVNGVALERWELDRELAMSIAVGSFHNRVPEERMAELECDSLRRLVLKELKWQWARRHEVEVDPAAVEASWVEVRARFDSDDQYRQALAMKGISDADFRRAFERDAMAEAADAAVLADLTPPTEDQVEVYFTLHRDRYMSPEARHVVHALVYVPPTASPEDWRDAERRARELAAEVAGGEVSLADASASLLDRMPPRYHDQVGDLGFVHRGSLLPAVDEAVFAGAPGSITEPVKSIYGYHVLQILDARPPEPLGLDDVRDAVASTIATGQRQRRLDGFERELRIQADIEGSECTGAL